MSRRKQKNQWQRLAKDIEHYLFKEDYQPASPESIREILDIPLSKKNIYQEALSHLLREKVIRLERGQLMPVKEEFLIATGTIRVHVRGFGFLIPDEKNKFPVDIFVPKHLTKGAVDGDHVEVMVSPTPTSDKGPEGKVVAIIRRGRSHLAGIVVEILPDGGGYVYAPLLGTSQRIRVHPPEKELRSGDRVVLKVLEWGSDRKEGMGEVSAFLGHISDPSCDVPAAIEEFEIEHMFPRAVLNEVKEFGSQVSKNEMEGRVDLRSLETFTIDPDTAKDFDDALSLSKDSKGHFHLAVHIADVSHYVKPGTHLDKEAKRRCNSVYFPGEVVPMLPHELSSHLCSLKPNVNRLTITVFVTFDDEGNVLNHRVARSVIRSAKRFTYKEALAVLEGTKKNKHQETLFLMVELCHRLKKKRQERGSIEFTLPDTQVLVNSKGAPEGIEIVMYDITHQLVEEFMLKANEIVATHLAKNGKPLTYRVHEVPSDENRKEFVRLANAFGFSLPDNPSSEELQQLFEEVRTTPYGQFLATAFIRSMRLAIYSTQNVGHYGLGLEYYTHFTSPIRRYIDLIVHRVLLNEIDPKEDLEAIALECSEKERLSAKAENSVVILKKLRLLEQFQKKEPDRVFEAVILGVKPFGFVFEVVELLMEGFIPISEIDDDYFVFEEGKRRLKGTRTHSTYQTADRIEVSIRQVNCILQEVKWNLIPKSILKKRKSLKRI